MESGRRVSYDLPFSDRASVNGKRLLEIYKDEKQSRGTKNVSMMKIAWNFCRSRVIVASIFWTLSIVLYLLAPVIFLKMTLEALDSEKFGNVTLGSENEPGGETMTLLSIKILKYFIQI